MSHTRWFLLQLCNLALTAAGVFGAVVIMALTASERLPHG